MKTLIFLAILNLGCLFAQEKTIKGQILVKQKPIENVHVSNLSKNTNTTSDSSGNFSISVEIGDLLVFSAVQLEYWRQSIKKYDYEKGEISIQMIEKTVELEEIEIVEYPNINAKDLGIINYSPKKYTPAQRRLFSATSTPVDLLLNWFSGRKKMLEKGIEVEKKQFMLQDLLFYADDAFLIESLKIPAIYAQGFRYYAVEDAEIVLALKSKDKEQIRFVLGETAQSFLHYLDNFKEE